MYYSGISGAVPATPLGFMVQERQDVLGLFDITSVTAPQAAPEKGLSAFIFRVETVDETLYVLQVVHQTVVTMNMRSFTLQFPHSLHGVVQCSQV